MLKNKIMAIVSVLVISAALVGGISAKAETVSAPITVTATQPDTLELTVSSSTVDFGAVTGVGATTCATTLTASVKSSLAYDMDVVATGDFSNTTEPTATHIPITKLGVKIDGGGISKFAGVNVPKNLVTGATDTSSLADVKRVHSIVFDLDETVGYKAGAYSAPLTLTVTQN